MLEQDTSGQSVDEIRETCGPAFVSARRLIALASKGFELSRKRLRRLPIARAMIQAFKADSIPSPKVRTFWALELTIAVLSGREVVETLTLSVAPLARVSARPITPRVQTAQAFAGVLAKYLLVHFIMVVAERGLLRGFGKNSHVWRIDQFVRKYEKSGVISLLRIHFTRGKNIDLTEAICRALVKCAAPWLKKDIPIGAADAPEHETGLSELARRAMTETVKTVNPWTRHSADHIPQEWIDCLAIRALLDHFIAPIQRRLANAESIDA